MNPEPITKIEGTYAEAPASWNTSYITQDGFVCRITLRGETGKDLLDKASVALAYLMEHGFQPEHNNRKDTKECPIHHCEMIKYEKGGHSWFGHRLIDGSWCRGVKK